MPPHVLGDARLTHRDPQLLQFPVNPRRTPEGIRGGQLAYQGTNVWWHARAPGALATLPGPEQTKAPPVPADDGLRLDEVKGRAPAAPCRREPRPEYPVGRREAKASTADRLTTPSWWRSAMISRCSAARDRTRNRSEWSSETRTDATRGGYRRKPVTSIDATRTVFPIVTGSSPAIKCNVLRLPQHSECLRSRSNQLRNSSRTARQSARSARVLSASMFSGAQRRRWRQQRARVPASKPSHTHRRVSRCPRRRRGFWPSVSDAALGINSGLPVSKPSYPPSVSPMTIPCSVISNVRRSLL
jgi:hypothetical protein